MKLTLILFVLAFAPSLFPQAEYSVQGNGFFRLEGVGGIKYTKGGAFFLHDGVIVHESGLPLSPLVRIPLGAAFEIQRDGFVIVGKTQISRLVLAVFEEPIEPAEAKPFYATSKPRLGNPGDAGFGIIAKAPTNEPIQSARAETQTGVARITLLDSAEVDTPTLSLGQIAEVNAAEPLASQLRALDLGPSPRVGADRLVTKVTIQSVLRSTRFPIDQIEIVADHPAKVRRASQLLAASDLNAFCLGWIATNMPDVGPVHPTSPLADRKVAAGSLTLQVASHKDTGKAIVLVIKASVCEEIQFVQQVVFTRGEKVVTPQVKPGQSVRVHVVSNGVTVEVLGQVKSIAGRQITVFIPDTKANMTGTLKPDGTVEVKV